MEDFFTILNQGLQQKFRHVVRRIYVTDIQVNQPLTQQPWEGNDWNIYFRPPPRIMDVEVVVIPLTNPPMEIRLRIYINLP